jgi:hypothetical protein
MARAQPVSIAGIYFPKKSDALAHLRGILYRFEFEERISGVDEEFLKAAIERHPDCLEKVGVGIKHFFVGRGDFGTRCFWIRRVDGTQVRFSFKSCV